MKAANETTPLLSFDKKTIERLNYCTFFSVSSAVAGESVEPAQNDKAKTNAVANPECMHEAYNKTDQGSGSI